MRIKSILLSLVFVGFYSNASVVIDGTRVIYPGNEKEVTVKLTNAGSNPLLIQSWIDDGDASSNPDNIDVPFVLSPPITRINGGKGQSLRINYTGRELPQDKESIFWLNVLEVPQAEATSKNQLQIAFRSRLKFIYRPVAITDSSTQAADSVLWTKTNNSLVAKNNSPYFISLIGIAYTSAGGEVSVDADMVAPFSSKSFSLNNEKNIDGRLFKYSYIDDWGAVRVKNAEYN